MGQKEGWWWKKREGEKREEKKAHCQVAIGGEKEETEMVGSLDVGHSDKDCKVRQHRQQGGQRDRDSECKEVQRDKNHEKKNGRESQKKDKDNPCVSLSPRVNHWQSAPSFCRILSPLYSLTRANVVVASQSPSSPRSQLTYTSSLSLSA